MSKPKERKRIAKDPFHQKILEALAGHLDPQVFEACMGDLVQRDFAGLVPVPGCDDAGMDGAIASGKGEPFPLVCTIQENVHGNLEKSLDSFLARGLSSRLVALATSQALTPAQIRNLYSLAQKKGFTLLQVFERSGVADRLYRNSVWCKRLLHVTGSPSALSVVPLSRRPFVDTAPIGRDEDAEWLRSTSGDRVLVGEPGSGKTHLFSWLIRQGWPALFLVSEDETAIANAFRDQQPGIVIVDDAHVSPRRLDRLRRLRQEIGGDFDIVASTWPGAAAEVQEALGCTDSQVRKLELLPRNTILEILRQVGAEASEEVLRSLVDQSSNKPGLAVTIARLWLQGDWQKILDGSVLSRTLLTLFRDLVGGEAAEVLACFSLGGSAGASPGAVAGFLGLRAGEIDRIAAGLSAGGALSEAGRAWVVKPEVLRSALLREVFFSGRPTAQDYRKLLRSLPDYDRAVEAILSARLYRSVIDDKELRELVSNSRDNRLWRRLVLASTENAAWVLGAYPGDVLDLAEDLLHRIPEGIIPRILERAEEYSRTREFQPDRAMSILSTWVQDIRAGAGEWIRRRSMVARAARQLLLRGGVRSIGIHGICIGLSPSIRGSSLDPGMGNTVLMRSGLLPPQDLQEITKVWGDVAGSIQAIDRASWQHLSSTLWDWIHPEHVARRTEISEEERRAARGVAERILTDLAPRVEGSPGLQGELSRIAAKLGLDLGLPRDELFELLYPPRDGDIVEHRERQAQRTEAVKQLAAEWAQEPPQEVAARVAFHENEAWLIDYSWMPNIINLCEALAESAEKPEAWLSAFREGDLRGPLVAPFLERLVDLRREGWDQTVLECLDSKDLAWRAASSVLGQSDPPPKVLARVLEQLDEEVMLVESMCLRRDIPLPTLGLLLKHPVREVALAAAVGEWCSEPQGNIREAINREWRAAILSARTEEYEEVDRHAGLQYWLSPILASDPDLAFDWLRVRLQDSDLPEYFMSSSPFATAARVLRKEQKEALLEELEPKEILRSLIPALVGRDEDLYRGLLGQEHLKEFHLEPVGGPQDPEWDRFVLAALDAGHAPESIALVSFGSSHSWAGSGIEYWERWDHAFAMFEGHPRADFREVVQLGRERAQEALNEARVRQRRFELHGLGREG